VAFSDDQGILIARRPSVRLRLLSARWAEA
jgi:hypothetical protein